LVPSLNFFLEGACLRWFLSRLLIVSGKGILAEHISSKQDGRDGYKYFFHVLNIMRKNSCISGCELIYRVGRNTVRQMTHIVHVRPTGKADFVIAKKEKGLLLNSPTV